MNTEELRLLSYLITNFQTGRIKPDDPRTHIPYSKALDDLGLPNDGRSPGESLNRHAMGGLAQWLQDNNLPAITGIIINKLSHSERERAGLPSATYFSFHGRKDLDFQWQQEQIRKGIALDWQLELSKRGIVLPNEFKLPEEVPDSIKEGAKTKITVNRYERDRNARNACIAHYGTNCVVCGFNFELVYGKRGKEFIHVHHLIPLSEIREEYIVDPIGDLRPVCPNCHAMLHKGENISIEKLKDEIAFNKAKRN